MQCEFIYVPEINNAIVVHVIQSLLDYNLNHPMRMRIASFPW